MKRFFNAIVRLITDFVADQPFMLAGALSFYALLSMAPLLLVVISVAGLVFGEQAAQGQLVEQIRGFVGESGGRVVETVLANASGQSGGWFATLLGLVLILVGATTVFGQLKAALNQIWDVTPAPERSAVLGVVRTRLLALGIVLLIGLVLLVLIVASWSLRFMQQNLGGYLPGEEWLWYLLDIGLTLLILTLLTGLIFKTLPDATIAWSNVWLGAAATATLLGLGKYGIDLYMTYATVASVYGAAGSLVLLLLWIYYSALIVFFGAEVTQAIARRRGRPIRPAEYAVRTDSTGS